MKDDDLASVLELLASIERRLSALSERVEKLEKPHDTFVFPMQPTIHPYNPPWWESPVTCDAMPISRLSEG